MKRNIALATSILFAVTFVLSMAATAQASDGKHCSKASVAGKWAFTSAGSIVDIGPLGAVGSFIQDSSGNITGSETVSLNGAVADETFTATATVNSDCTGTDVFQVYESGVLVRTSTLNLVYDDNGRKARAIFTSIVLPNGIALLPILTVDAEQL